MTPKRWTLVAVCVATAMLMLDIAVVNTALSRIAEDLGAGLSGLQWVVDAYTLALASVVLTAGSLAILAHAFPEPRERAGALAAYGATIGGTFAIGPLVGGALTSGLDWQWIFLINLPIGAGAIWITRTYVEESRDPRAPRVDWLGQATLAAGLFLLVLGLLRGNEDGWGSTAIVSELADAAVLLAAFVAIESRVKEPMLALKLFRNPSFTGAQVAAAAISATFFAVFLYTTLYLQQVLGMSPIEAGLAYLPATLVIFFVSGATANLGEKVSPWLMVGGGLFLVAIGMGLMTLAGAGSSWTATLPGMLVAGVGTGLFNPALTAVALGSAPIEQSGLAAGTNDTFRQAGIAVGVAALGALVPSGAAFDPTRHVEYVNGLHDALWAGAVVAALGAVAAGMLIHRAVKAPRVAGELVPEVA